MTQETDRCLAGQGRSRRAVFLTALAAAAALFVQASPSPAQQIGAGAKAAPVLDAPAKAAPVDWTATVPAPPGTTVIPRTPPKKSKLKADFGKLNLAVLLTESGGRIDKGVVWRIYHLGGASNQVPKLYRTDRNPAPSLELPAGSYIVNAAFGRAHLTRKIVVKPGAVASEQFVLNAGGLRVAAVRSDGTVLTGDNATYDIFSDERNVFGNRTQVMTRVRPGVIIRLNAGIFHIVSTYGDANAKVSADITVEAGKLSEVQIRHSAARVTFKLVARSGGEALAGTKWMLTDLKGVVVKESVGAIPTHIVAAGSYIVSAAHGTRSFRAQFTIAAGQDAEVEVVME